MPTIVNGSKHMQAVLYTGTGATQTINSLSFKPDFIWIKSRSAATDNKLTDSVRGVTKGLISNATSAESTDTNGITAFTSTGFTLGSDSVYNTNGATYVAWCWKAGEGTTSSNTSGSITSTVSANPSAGFSIVTYTGNGSAATVGHGIGVAPKFVIVKNRTLTDDWCVYHKDAGAANYSQLNLNSAFGANSTIWNNTDPTSSVFSVGTYLSKSGSNYVGYCWSEVEGFSKFGKYTGNGSADGPFLYLGFRPKFVIFKRTNSTSWWLISDTTRSPSNVAAAALFPNLADVEYTTAIDVGYDFVSNGIKIRNTGNESNANGSTYVYAAFAENPLKHSLAR